LAYLSFGGAALGRRFVPVACFFQGRFHDLVAAGPQWAGMVTSGSAGVSPVSASVNTIIMN